MREEAKVLEDHRHLGPAQVTQLPLVQIPHVVAVDDDVAAGWLDQARQGAEQGGLARAREAHDDKALATLDFKIHVLDRHHVTGLFLNFRAGFAAVVGLQNVLGITAENLPDAAG